jgi:thioredoxin-related protein
MMNSTIRVGAIVAVILVLAVVGCRKKTNPAPSAPAVTQKITVIKPTTVPADANAASTGWLTDFAAAQKKAATEGKDLLINFSGSDWCVWCKRLDEEVFSQKLFLNEAQSKFVFVLLDFPHNTSGQSEALQAQNQRLIDQYGVSGFPTVILADATGKPYAQTSYEEGGPLAYLEHLAELRMQRPAK